MEYTKFSQQTEKNIEPLLIAEITPDQESWSSHT